VKFLIVVDYLSSSLLGPNIRLGIIFSNILSLLSPVLHNHITQLAILLFVRQYFNILYLIFKFIFI